MTKILSNPVWYATEKGGYASMADESTSTLRKPAHARTWRPPTDLYETDSAYIVRVEIAGMIKEEFVIQLDAEKLEIRGFRPNIPVNYSFHQMEIPYGNFRTVVNLPAAVIDETVSAEYTDGFLIVILQKESPKYIPIKEE